MAESLKTPEMNRNKPELAPISEFTQVKALWNKAFKDDLTIVGHPQTKKRTPFNGINSDDDHGRQYNLTTIPEEMNEKEFLNAYSKCDTLFISCMDKDASGPGWQQFTKNGKKVMMLAMAGGVIQFSEKRQKALQTMLKYLSEHNVNGHIKDVIVTDHDNTCGAIKVLGLDGKTLAEYGNIDYITPKSIAEKLITKQMIKYYSNKVNAQEFFPQAKLQLAEIDRQGGIKFTDIDSSINLSSLEEIKASLRKTDY